MRKIFIFVGAICTIFFAGYLIKCRIGIDLFKTFHLTDILPVKFLQTPVEKPLIPLRGSLILYDDFTVNNHYWDRLWMREKGMVSMRYFYDTSVNKKNLLLENRGEKDWSLSHNKLICVDIGDSFLLNSDLKIEGENNFVYFTIILYDSQMKVIDWVYSPIKSTTSNFWVNVTGKFVIPQGVKFIRFRIVGFGMGKVFLDIVKFYKI